jgi:hypothetical protein
MAGAGISVAAGIPDFRTPGSSLISSQTHVENISHIYSQEQVSMITYRNITFLILHLFLKSVTSNQTLNHSFNLQKSCIRVSTNQLLPIIFQLYYLLKDSYFATIHKMLTTLKDLQVYLMISSWRHMALLRLLIVFNVMKVILMNG